ncbi:AMP-dependent synthetase/ligase domain-containing protein [Desulfonema limicola]|uniref:AMP-dependent synthetase/ligase domain-containing protein n=1 Tax=Desulfonema limicola TaxID=45656 RepID=A0A975B8B5_9BACT|nr:phenylacetate--CoA ligase family protein [Desulfonema limicola]QTA80450.1 AMP-dependent synthetase/ligase domain-containing protein [Desulfonema limicola]
MMEGNKKQDLSPDDRAQLQLERLQSTLNRAYRNVLFHQNRQNKIAQKTGRDTSVFESLDMISDFPFMQRTHLGEHYPYGLFAVPLRDIVRIHTAPGTGQNPSVTGYTRQDLKIWQEMVAQAFEAAEVTSNDILQISLDPGLANWGRDYKDGAESLGLGVIPNTPISPEKQLMILRDYKTSVLVTTPSEASQLAAQMIKSQLNPGVLNLRHLILVGEPVLKQFRDQIEEKLHVTTWLHYGLSEVPGPAIAYECKYHKGLHINEDHFLPEIIDPESGNILPKGEKGELVLTSLTIRAFPLIRFRTGEGASFITEPCPCGRTLTRMNWLDFRTDDILNINGVKVHQDQILYCLKSQLGFTPLYRILIKKQGGQKNYLEISLLMENNLFSDEIKILENQIKLLKDNLHENLGVPVQIKLKENFSI